MRRERERDVMRLNIIEYVSTWSLDRSAYIEDVFSAAHRRHQTRTSGHPRDCWCSVIDNNWQYTISCRKTNQSWLRGKVPSPTYWSPSLSRERERERREGKRKLHRIPRRNVLLCSCFSRVTWKEWWWWSASLQGLLSIIITVIHKHLITIVITQGVIAMHFYIFQ